MLACLSACGEAGETEIVDVETEESVGVPWEEYRAAAKAAGGADYYRVEGDLYFFSEQSLRAHYDELVATHKSKLAIFQRISTGFEPKFPRPRANNITYCVSNAFTNKSTVVADMASATRAWERVTNVRFRYLSGQDATCDQNNANVEFAVMLNPASGGCAVSKLHWLPGCRLSTGASARGVLLMNYTGFPPPAPQANMTPTGVLRHELGHMLGFRHEHPWAPGAGGCLEQPSSSTSDYTGRRLTTYDQVSVMHYRECAGPVNTDYTISKLDGIGARRIYGMPASWHVPVMAPVLL
jgi:hypothetical protein